MTFAVGKSKIAFKTGPAVRPCPGAQLPPVQTGRGGHGHLLPAVKGRKSRTFSNLNATFFKKNMSIPGEQPRHHGGVPVQQPRPALSGEALLGGGDKVEERQRRFLLLQGKDPTTH